MKKLVATVFFAFLLLLNHSTQAGWPIFSYPTLSELINANVIETEGCQPGEGTIKTSSAFPVNFVSYNKQPWRWHYDGSRTCIPLNQTLNFIHFTIIQNSLNSVVTAHYITPAGIPFEFVLTTSGEHWQCYQFDPAYPIVTCANDI